MSRDYEFDDDEPYVVIEKQTGTLSSFVIGAAIGAGLALLFAPQSGARTRHNIARRGRRFRTRTADAWEDLRHELRYAARRGRKKLAAKINGALRDRRERQSLRDGIVVED